MCMSASSAMIPCYALLNTERTEELPRGLSVLSIRLSFVKKS